MLIFDRTQDDVNKALQNSGSTAPLKGCYNLSDIRRVYSFIQTLTTRLNANGYPVDISVKTYADNEIFGEEDIRSYLLNISKLRNCIDVWDSTPTSPILTDWIDFKVANDIEKILFDISQVLDQVETPYLHCGTISSNQFILPQTPLEASIKALTVQGLKSKRIKVKDFHAKKLTCSQFTYSDW